MKCPKCESENTQRLEVAYHSGTQNISTTGNSVGVGFSGGRMGLAGGVTKTSGQTQTTLAAACAPPVKKRVFHKGNFIGISTLASALYLLTVHWTLFVVALVAIFFGWQNLKQSSKYNEEVWPSLYQHWAESWICHKCGSVYQQK